MIYKHNGSIITGIDGKWLTHEESPTPPPIIEEVIIGIQTWMSKNLAVDDGGTGINIVDNVTANGVNFGTQYYYTWDAAVRIADSIDGWHLPTLSEWRALESFLGINTAGTKLKSTSGWDNSGNGTDDYGFTALPVGWYNYNTLDDLGSMAHFWASNEDPVPLNAASSYITYQYPYLYTESASKSRGYSVRLIKDT